MAKNSGIRALKNLKNKIAQKNPAVQTQRVVVAKKKEEGTGVSVAPVVNPLPSKAETRVDYLEDTPEVSSVENKRFERPAKSNDFLDEHTPKSRLSRSRRKKPGLFSGIFSIFTKKDNASRTDDALAFASNNKRLGKKGRRNRMVLLYVGTGVVVVAVMLIVFLAPGGIAAPAEAEVTGGNKAAVIGAQVLPDAMQSPTATPAGTAATESPTEPATSPDNVVAALDDPLESPTMLPTTEPTEEPTESPTPIPTTEPDPTPAPISVDELVDFFVVEADAYYNDMGYSNNHYEYTDEEYYMLAQIIDIEARGESFEGKVAVGNVVMNRVLCRSFPGSSIKDVITRPGQFAYAGREGRSPSSSSKRAARAVLDDELWVVAQDIYYFRSGAPSGENWGSHKFYKTIGGHCFYRHSYSGRHRGGEAPPALFERTYKYAQYGCKPEKRVYRVQYMLNKLGYDVYADSYFGKDTKIALMDFQQKKGLDADGVAGPATVKALIKEFGVENYYSRFVA